MSPYTLSPPPFSTFTGWSYMPLPNVAKIDTNKLYLTINSTNLHTGLRYLVTFHSADTNYPVRIDYSYDLASWSTYGSYTTSTNTGVITILVNAHQQRFFRAFQNTPVPTKIFYSRSQKKTLFPDKLILTYYSLR
jgi:hypothetical protein